MLVTATEIFLIYKDPKNIPLAKPFWRDYKLANDKIVDKKKGVKIKASTVKKACCERTTKY